MLYHIANDTSYKTGVIKKCHIWEMAPLEIIV